MQNVGRTEGLNKLLRALNVGFMWLQYASSVFPSNCAIVMPLKLVAVFGRIIGSSCEVEELSNFVFMSYS